MISLRKSPLGSVLLVTGLYAIGTLLARYLGLADVGGAIPLGALDLGSAGLALAWGIGHCDGLDGPVVTQARKALETGNVNRVLPWVRSDDEDEIRHAFEHALAVRKLGPQARELADTHFFETLVRIHRAGEGAPYTGLKPAGRDLGPAIPAADQALEGGSVDAVVKLLTTAVRAGVHQRFHAAESRRKFDANDVRAGRAYVEAYVPYIHYVEQLWHNAQGGPHGHSPEGHHAHAH
ncbi:MAG: hypothetical protein HY661_01985 [Betaproteobacteria bacterium]|nr:hypothetical protein [Betaproteobacteria bacterium]